MAKLSLNIRSIEISNSVQVLNKVMETPWKNTYGCTRTVIFMQLYWNDVRNIAEVVKALNGNRQTDLYQYKRNKRHYRIFWENLSIYLSSGTSSQNSVDGFVAFFLKDEKCLALVTVSVKMWVTIQSSQKLMGLRILLSKLMGSDEPIEPMAMRPLR